MFEAFEMTSCAVDSLFDTRVSARDQSETYKTSHKIAVSSNPVISLTRSSDLNAFALILLLVDTDRSNPVVSMKTL